MTLRALILSTMLVGCGYKLPPCDADSGEFVQDRALTGADIDLLLVNGKAVEDIVCEEVCNAVQEAESGWQVSVIDSCTLHLDTDIELVEDTGGTLLTADPEAEVGVLTCEGTEVEYYCTGRRPLGHVECKEGGTALGDYLARCAHLEAASVTAFEQLARQLAGWGAPEVLVDRCRLAAAEEAQHAAVMRALAKAEGAVVPTALLETADEGLFAVALHNAVEGCVGEAWAAVVAAWQAEHATTAALRGAGQAVADDEAGHAQLAWDLHRWLMPRLSVDEQAVISAAQRRALHRLPARAARQARQLPDGVGLPPEGAVAMARHFVAGLA